MIIVPSGFQLASFGLMGFEKVFPTTNDLMTNARILRIHLCFSRFGDAKMSAPVEVSDRQIELLDRG
jgi:hypothetical protein